jgi:hypothetical protein
MVHIWRSYLWEKVIKVYGTYRHISSANFWRIEGLGIQKHPNLHLEKQWTNHGSSCKIENAKAAIYFSSYFKPDPSVGIAMTRVRDLRPIL